VAIFASDFFTLPAAAFKVASIFLRSPFNFFAVRFYVFMLLGSGTAPANMAKISLVLQTSNQTNPETNICACIF